MNTPKFRPTIHDWAELRPHAPTHHQPLAATTAELDALWAGTPRRNRDRGGRDIPTTVWGIPLIEITDWD